MAYYMVQVAYRGEAWAKQIKNPSSVISRTQPLVEALGGRIESAYYSFGDYDLVEILEMPDNVSAAALSLVASAGGALKSFKTTPLLTVDEGIAAMKQAKASRGKYRAPK